MATHPRPTTTDRLLALIREGRTLTRWQQLVLVFLLSLPAMLAQIATILMFFIDAAMVGHLGANEAASVGLVETTIWFFGGVTSALATGYYVQVAHRVGAKDGEGARAVLRQGFLVTTLFSLALALIGIAISGALPRWLGGTDDVAGGATVYFLIFSAFVPMMGLNQLCAGMLRCAGDIKTPSLMEVLACVLDVGLNFLLIFPSHHFRIGATELTLPGAGLGVAGAAWGTGIAMAIVAIAMTWLIFTRTEALRITRERWRGWRAFLPERATLSRALGIGTPIGVQRVAMNIAQIFITMIVAPLGAFAIAANSFAVTAESICYMPGYGISDAATTLVGQSIGAQRYGMARRLAGMSVGLAMVIMALMGVVLYVGAEAVMAVMTPQPEIIRLGADALRIEAFAEPMFAASIVCYGAFVGAGRTTVPALMNLGSMWGVRITLALMLVGSMGLNGVWAAMAIELSFRGLIFLLRMWKGNWMNLKL